MNNIHVQHEGYDIQYHVQVANGAGLKIMQSGTSTILSLSKSFVLNQILFVINVKKSCYLFSIFV
jgi:hypothetical protein